LGKKISDKDAEKDQAQPANPAPRLVLRDKLVHCRHKVFVDARLEKPRRRQFQGRHDGDHAERERNTPPVRLHVGEQPPHQVRVVRFAERLFFVNVAHARSSSSSKSCF
jgi:hypothetical protein